MIRAGETRLTIRMGSAQAIAPHPERLRGAERDRPTHNFWIRSDEPKPLSPPDPKIGGERLLKVPQNGGFRGQRTPPHQKMS
jgi:hypothetical protein